MAKLFSDYMAKLKIIVIKPHFLFLSKKHYYKFAKNSVEWIQ